MSTHPAILPDANLLKTALQSAMLQQAFCNGAAAALDAEAHVLSQALRFTARQEAEHAAILRALLPGACTPPPAPALPSTPAAILAAAIAREEASCALLHDAARCARTAGLSRQSDALLHIAGTEGVHARRFRLCLACLEDGSLLHSPRSVSWFCLSCGGLHHGCDAPAACESCGMPQGHFIRSDFSPIALR